MDTFERKHANAGLNCFFFTSAVQTGLFFMLAGLDFFKLAGMDFFFKNTIKTHPIQDTTGQELNCSGAKNTNTPDEKNLIETKMIEHVKNMLLFLIIHFQNYIKKKNNVC